MGHAKRRRGITKQRPLEAADFVMSDGLGRGGFDGVGKVQTLAEAGNHWQALRTETWRLWSRRPSTRPPRGAEFHDGLDSIEDLDDFRQRQPRAAKAISEYLDLWVDLVEAHRHRHTETLRRHAATRAVGLLVVGDITIEPNSPHQPDETDPGLTDQGEPKPWNTLT